MEPLISLLRTPGFGRKFVQKNESQHFEKNNHQNRIRILQCTDLLRFKIYSIWRIFNFVTKFI